MADDVLFTVNDYRDRIYADVLQIPRSVTRVQDSISDLAKQANDHEDDDDDEDEEGWDDINGTLYFLVHY